MKIPQQKCHLAEGHKLIAAFTGAELGKDRASSKLDGNEPVRVIQARHLASSRRKPTTLPCDTSQEKHCKAGQGLAGA